MLTFTVEGRPVPWQRRVPYKGRYLTPKRSRAYKERVGLAALHAINRQQMAWKPLTVRVLVSLRVYPPDRRHGDVDNYEKQIGDALQGIAYVNDKQVRWSPSTTIEVDRERPRVEVEIREAGE